MHDQTGCNQQYLYITQCVNRHMTSADALNRINDHLERILGSALVDRTTKDLDVLETNILEFFDEICLSLPKHKNGPLYSMDHVKTTHLNMIYRLPGLARKESYSIKHRERIIGFVYVDENGFRMAPIYKYSIDDHYVGWLIISHTHETLLDNEKRDRVRHDIRWDLRYHYYEYSPYYMNDLDAESLALKKAFED